MKRVRIQLTALALCSLCPAMAYADIEKITFTTSEQSIAPSAVSEQITVEAQDGNDTAVSGNSVCMQITSSSGTGEFSTNETNWSSPVHTLALTLSASQFRRNFYYRDAHDGTFTLTAQAGMRPGSSCTGWTPGATWSASQIITVGSGGPVQAETTVPDTSTTTQATTHTATTTSAETTTTTTTTTNTIVSSYVPPPAIQLFADGGDDRTVIVGADSTFRGRAYNRTQEIVDTVRFNWNFGDGTTAEGASVLHSFAYPGRYAVVLNIAENTYAASDRIIVAAVPAQILFTVNADASVSIENQENRDIDITHWMVRSFGRTFTIPEGTVVLAGETLRLAHATLGFTVGPQTELLYPNGTPVTLVPKQSSDVPPQLNTTLQQTPPETAPKKVVSVRASAPAASAVVVDAPTTADEAAQKTASSSVAAVAEGVPNGSYVWLLGAGGIAIAACGAVYAMKRAQKNEWDIIDESE